MAQSLPQTETFPESAASTKPKISRLSWRALIFLFFLGAIGFADKSIGTVIAVPISSEFKLNATQWGIISGSFFWLFSIAALILGAWSDRIGTKRVLSLLAAIWSLAQFLAIFTGSFLTFLLTRVLLGIGEGPYTGVAITEASRWVPRVRRGFALAVVTCGGLVGPAVLTPIMVIVMARVGWRSVFLILGLSSVIWLVAWLFFGKEAPLEEPERETSVSAAKERIAWSSLWHILRSPAVLLITLASFGAYWMQALGLSWISLYLVNVRHFSLVALAPISILIVLGTCAMQLLFSTLADRLFRRSGNLRAYVYVMGAALIVTAVIFFGFVALPSALSLIVVTLNPNGAVFSTAGALIANTTPSRGRATVQSATVALATTAGILAPSITGPIIQAGGSQGYLNAFALSSGLVLLIALISLLFIHPRAQTPDTV